MSMYLSTMSMLKADSFVNKPPPFSNEFGMIVWLGWLCFLKQMSTICFREQRNFWRKKTDGRTSLSRALRIARFTNKPGKYFDVYYFIGYSKVKAPLLGTIHYSVIVWRSELWSVMSRFYVQTYNYKKCPNLPSLPGLRLLNGQMLYYYQNHSLDESYCAQEPSKDQLIMCIGNSVGKAWWAKVTVLVSTERTTLVFVLHV